MAPVSAFHVEANAAGSAIAIAVELRVRGDRCVEIADAELGDRGFSIDGDKAAGVSELVSMEIRSHGVRANGVSGLGNCQP